MANQIFVLSGDRVLQQRQLGSEAVQVGSAADCDVRLEHPEVPPRAYLIQERAGTVWLHDLERVGDEPRVLAYDRRVAVGPYVLVRRARTGSEEPGTQLVAREVEPVTRWTLLLGRATEARRVTVTEGPFGVGGARDNDWVLSDPTVSQRHCRFEPSQGRLWVRDLGSTNGTFVQGVRTQRAELGPGMCVRVGRTDIHVLAHADLARGVKLEGDRQMVAASGAMHEVLAECQRLSRLPWPVLVLGPSGSGKEEIAQLLHRESVRRGRPFVALNAGGLPRELIESELFGHERGAFTGAVGQRRGAFEQAIGGTLFLDEIGELPFDLQARLLRVLETWQIRRVGSEQALDVDVRLVCATHCDLARMVRQGTFRQDLFYRLAQFIVHVPPLAERPEDVLALAEHFLARLAPELGPRVLTGEARTRLLAHNWPGNARELRNVLGVAAAMCPGQQLEVGDIEAALRRLCGPRLEAVLDEDVLAQALRLHRGNLSAVARSLSIPRSTLRDQIKKREK